MRTHDEIRADVSLYALGSLDPEERLEVEQHLASGCEECARELESWNEVVSSMSLLAPETKAPDLAPRLLRMADASAKPEAAREKGPAAREASRRWWPVPLAAAAAIALVLGGMRAFEWRAERDQQLAMISDLQSALGVARDDLTQTAEVLAEREKDVGALRAALAKAEESAALLQSPRLQLIGLAQPPEAPPAKAHLLVSPESKRALLYAFDLPPAPAGKTYELWWITADGGPVQAGLFEPDPRGLGRLETTLPEAGGAIQAAAVTVEPDGGTTKPTGQMVLLGKL